MEGDNFDLSKFLERNISSDSESETDFNVTEPQKEIAGNLLVERFSNVLRLQIKNNLSNQTTSKILNLINSNFPEAVIQLPESRDAIDTFLQSDLNYTVYLRCYDCDEFVKDKKKCPQCGVTYNKCSKKNNFLVHFPLKPQILRILHRHFHIIVPYLNRQHKDGIISDVDDGILLKNIFQKNLHVGVLSFTMNTDGGKMFNSSTGSLWPVQLYLNFLPPSIRFESENIIISTLFYGKTKPDMTDLLYFLAV